MKMDSTDEFMRFGKFVLGSGVSTEWCNLLLSWLGELSHGKDFNDVLNSSTLIPLVLGFYNSCIEINRVCGRRMIDLLINSLRTLSVENIQDFIDLCISLDKDPQYFRLRSTLCEKLSLCEEGVQDKNLEVFVYSILGDVLDGFRKYVESHVEINGGWYLNDIALLASIRQHFSEELMDHVLFECQSFLSFLDPLLLKGVEECQDDKLFLAVLHHIKVFSSLSIILGTDDHISSIILGRSKDVIKIAIRAVELDRFILFERYLTYGNLMDLFVEQLLIEFNSILGGRVNEHTLLISNRLLILIRRISNNEQRWDEDIRTLMENRGDAICAMSTLFEVVSVRFCSDENLLVLERSFNRVDPEFRMELLHRVIPEIERDSFLILEVSRDNFVEDSYKSVLAATSSQLRGILLVKFAGENGRGPGVLREWLLLLFQGLLAFGNYFENIQDDRRILMPTRGKVKDDNFFIFFGRVLALSLMHHVQGGFMLDHVVIKMLAEIDISLADVMELYGMSTSDGMPTDVYDESEDGMPTGDDMYDESQQLAEGNFIAKYFTDLLTNKVTNIKKGIDDIFGSERRRIFFAILHAFDMQVVISGEPAEIMIEDWAFHTVYNHCEINDILVSWFWKIVGKFSAEQKQDLLCFWTSIRYLPPGGFKNLEFRPLLHIFKIDEETANAGITSSTCGYQLNLPLYESYEILEDRLKGILPFCHGFFFT